MLITERGIMIARIESMREQQGKTSDEARLARLERAGAIRRGRPIPQWLIDKAPVKLKKEVGVVQALLDERHESER